jgi:hypothetical protein
VHQQLQRILGELVRRLGVQDDHSDRGSRPREDRDGHHRLEALLLERRDVLHPRVLHGFIADELGRAVARDPAGEPLVETHLHVAHGVGEHR